MEALWEINASAKSNMAGTGDQHWSYLGKCLADFHYIGVNYMVFDGWQSKAFTELWPKGRVHCPVAAILDLAEAFISQSASIDFIK